MLYKLKRFEYPSELLPFLRKAKIIEIISVFYLISIIILEYLVMGNIQTMKTVWFEDILSLIAPIAFLVTSKIFFWRATDRFPYGFHNITRIAFLVGSISLMAIGLFLCIDGIKVLIEQKKPDIPFVIIFNRSIWVGYLIILVMSYKIIAPFILGHIKIKLGKTLHDKTLYVDGRTNRADYVAAIGAIFGILLIDMGYWWSDASIAILISITIIYDGLKNTLHAFYDLMDEVPTTIESTERDPLVKKLNDYLLSLPWVSKVKIRMREEGHVCIGEALVIPKDSTQLIENIAAAMEEINSLHWRIQDFLICPVSKFPSE